MVAGGGSGRRKGKGPAKRARRLLLAGGPALFLLLLLAFCLLPRGTARPSKGAGSKETLLSVKESGPAGGTKKAEAGVLRGECRILDGQGRGVGGLPLLVWAGGEAFSAKTDGTGRFPWPTGKKKPGGTWWGLELFLSRGPKVSFLVRRNSLPGKIVLDPPLRDLSGRLLQGPGRASSPVPRARLLFLELPEMRILAEAATGEGGRWTVRLPREIPPGPVLLQAWSSRRRWLGAWFLGDLARKEIRLVSGKVPLRVCFRPHPPPPGSKLLVAPRFSRDPVVAETKPGERAAVDLLLPPGPQQVLLLGPKGECLGEGRFLSGRDREILLDVAEGGPAFLEGKVLGPGGTPLEGAGLSFFPLGLRGRSAPLPGEGDWNPFLAARVRVEGVTGEGGRFRLCLGPCSRGRLKVSFPAFRAERVVPVEFPRESPILVRLRKGTPLEIRDLAFEGKPSLRLLPGGLRWMLRRKGSGLEKSGRARCLPRVLAFPGPGEWVLRLAGGGKTVRLDLRVIPGRPLRLVPLFP